MAKIMSMQKTVECRYCYKESSVPVNTNRFSDNFCSKECEQKFNENYKSCDVFEDSSCIFFENITGKSPHYLKVLKSPLLIITGDVGDFVSALVRLYKIQNRKIYRD